MAFFHTHRIRAVLLCAVLVTAPCPMPQHLGAGCAEAGGIEANPAALQWIEGSREALETSWSGHLKTLYQYSRQSSDSLFSLYDGGGYDDGQLYLRLNHRTLYQERWEFEIHYESVCAAGDTQRALSRIATAAGAWMPLATPEEDDRRLLDLARTYHDDENSYGYHRLDRLMLAYHGGWGDVRVGRQAQTWGNGFLFNPMDLFNPFAPTDIARDYKIGDDMVHVQVRQLLGAQTQFVYVPRRDTGGGDIRWQKSSLAGKARWRMEKFEVETMLAHHYRDVTAGIGLTGGLGDAVWRTDATWTHVGNTPGDDDFLSWVANVDYSWRWWGKNVYAMAELYYNGAGRSDPLDALIDPVLRERLARGDLFVTGREYLGALLEMEIHPLVRVPVSLIVNARDPSAVLQPRVVWDALQNVQVVLSGTLYMGGNDTEFGGFGIPGTTLAYRPADTLTAWVTFFF